MSLPGQAWATQRAAPRAAGRGSGRCPRACSYPCFVPSHALRGVAAGTKHAVRRTGPSSTLVLISLSPMPHEGRL